jgi:type I restriction enzyme M protein
VLTLLKLLDDRRSQPSVERLVARMDALAQGANLRDALRDLVVPTAILLYLRWLEHFEGTSIRHEGVEINAPQVSVPKTLSWAALASLRGDALVARIEEIFLPPDLASVDLLNLNQSVWGDLLTEVEIIRQGRFALQIEQMARVWPALRQVPQPLLDELIELIAGLPFESVDDRRFCERLLAEMIQQGATPRSAFALPQVAADLMVEVARPKPGERIYDPCFGGGAVLAAAARRLLTDAQLSSPPGAVKSPPVTVHGADHYAPFWFVGMVRITLAGIDEPSLYFGDVLGRPRQPRSSRDGFDCVLAIPPWRRLAKTHALTSFDIPTTSSEGLFLQHIAGSLRPGGRAIVALPEAFLLAAGSEKRVRKFLMEEYYVEGVIGLPANVFKPYTSTESALLVFRRAKPAEAVRFLRFDNLRGVGRGQRRFSGPTAQDVARQFHERRSSAHNVWTTPIATLAAREWDLSPRRSGSDELDEVLDELQAIDDAVRITRLDKIAQVYSGVSYTREDLKRSHTILLVGGAEFADHIKRIKADSANRAGVPLIRAGDITAAGAVKPTDRLTQESLDQLSRAEAVRTGDVLLTAGGTIGKVALAGSEVDGALIARSVIGIRAEEQTVVPGFVALLLQSDVYQQWLSGHARGAVIQNLSSRVLRSLPMPVPPLAAQTLLVQSLAPSSREALAALKRLLLSRPAPMALLESVSASYEAVSEYELSAPPIADSIQEALRGAGTHTLAEVEQWVHVARKLRNELVHGSGLSKPTQAEVGLAEEILATYRMLEGVSQVPAGTARLSILQQAAAAIDGLIRHPLQADAEPLKLLRQLLDRARPILGREIDLMLSDVKIHVSLAEGCHVMPGDTTVRVIVENASTTPLRHFAIGQTPDLKSEEVPFFANGAKVERTLQVSVGDVERLDLTLAWVADRMDGVGISGDLPFSIPVERSLPTPLQELIDLGANPYVTGLPVKQPDMFFGRDGLISTIKRHLSTESGRSVLLLEGNRRAGKSSILFQLCRPNVLPDWLVVPCDFQGAPGHSSLPGIPTDQIFAFVAQRMAEVGESIGLHFWPDGQPTWNTAKPFKLEFRRAFANACAATPSFEVFKDLLAVVIEAIAPRRLLLMLDEFDRIQEGIDSGVTNPQVPQNFRFVLQNISGVSAILTGSRRMTQMRGDYWSVLFGLGHRIGVSSIDAPEAARLVTEPVSGRLTYPPTIVERITGLCACQPFLIQRLCAQIFNLCASEGRNTVTLEVLETAASNLVDGMEHFEAFWTFAGTERARFILCVIDTLTRDPHSPPVTLPRIEDELTKSGVAVRRDELVGDELKRLIELELVSMERDGNYRIAVPLLSSWISKNKDFEDQRERAARESGSG